MESSTSWRASSRVRFGVGIALSLLVFEGALRGVMSLRPVYEHLSQSYGSPGKALLWYNGSSSFFSVAQFSASTGWSNRPGTHDFRGDVIVNTQAGDRQLPHVEAPAYRVLAAGDSFTYGLEATQGDEWAAQLQPILGDVQVVNYGVAGFGLGQAWLHVRDQIQAGDHVLVGVNHHTMGRTTEYFETYLKPVFNPEVLGCEGTPAPITDPATYARTLQLRPRLLWLAEMIIWQSSVDAGVISDRSSDILSCFIQGAEKRDAKLSFLYFPDPSEFKAAPGSPPLLWTRPWFTSWCAEHDAPCLDLTDPFAAADGRGEAIVRGTHWSPTAHRLVATEIAAHLGSPSPTGDE